MKARAWRVRRLLGLLISGGGVAILIGDAISQLLR